MINISGDATDPRTVVDQTIAQLPYGQVAYNVPDAPNVDDMFTVQLLLDSRKTVDELKESLTAQGTAMGGSREAVRPHGGHSLRRSL